MIRRPTPMRAPGLALALALLVPAAAGADGDGRPAVGTPAPSFKLRGPDGALVRLDERAYPGKEKRWAKKRPVFLDFFRTDCGPCRKAMPELVALHERYGPKGVDVILVALIEPGDGRAKLDAYLAEQKLPFTVVLDPTEHTAEKYLGPTGALPASFVIDREGVLRAARHGGGAPMLEAFGAALDASLAAEPPPKETPR